MNFVSQLVDTNGTFKAWYLLKQEYRLNSNSYFQWLQLINSISEKWNFTAKQSSSDAKNLSIHGHHLIKGSRILILASKELYPVLISSRPNKFTSVTCFEIMFNAYNLDWTTYNAYLCSFQYKILHKILFLNGKLYLFWITKSTIFLLQYLQWNTNTFVLWVYFCQIFMAAIKWILAF